MRLNEKMSFRFLIDFDFDLNVEIKKITMKLWNDSDDKNFEKKCNDSSVKICLKIENEKNEQFVNFDNIKKCVVIDWWFS